jgi:hypothetical protein
MNICNVDGLPSSIDECTSLNITIKSGSDLYEYQLTDNGNGELLIRKTSDCVLIVKPKADNSIAII